MAGITDAPVRRMALRHGAGLVVSEMLASQALLEGQAEMTLRAMRFDDLPAGALHTVQLAGNDPYWMAQAARFAVGQGADLIDINMGCPAKRVTTGAAGAALLRDLPLACRILDAVRAAVDVPVTLKTRLGWDAGAHTAPLLVAEAARIGICLVTLHGRTRCQFYTGSADWAAIGAVKAQATIPVVANGDVTCCAHARAILAASGADGVMIGRGAQGRPWFPGQVARFLATGLEPADPPLDQQRDILLDMLEGWLSLYGASLGVRQARKHVGWALEAAAGVGETAGAWIRNWRARLLTLEQPAQLKAGIVDAFDDLNWRAAA